MSVAASDPRILFIVDPTGLSRNASLIRQLGAAHALLDDLPPEPVTAHQLVAVDVDLTHEGNCKSLRRLMRGRRHGYFQAFAVDLNRRLETIHAGIVGATDLTKRPFEAHELMNRVAMFEDRLRRPEAKIVRQSIGNAAEALGDLFGSLTVGDKGTVALPVVDTAGGEVIDAIADAGFENWVEEVRRHHEGTFQHCLIVTGLASAFGRTTGMSRRDIVTLTTAGLLHDIGKATVPVSILDKPGKLTEEETQLVRTHPGRGFEHLLGTSGIDPAVLAAVRGHHEYLDGSGYPDGLGGREIGDVTRILTICDVYGAMIERRSYKPPHSSEDALAVLDQMADEGKIERPLVRAFHHAIAA